MKLAIITTYPPSKGTLNEYAYYVIEALKTKDEIEEIILLVDELPQDENRVQEKPKKLPGQNEEIVPAGKDSQRIRILQSWRFNDSSNPFRIARTLRDVQADAVLFNIHFASFGDKKVAGGLGLLAPFFSKVLGFPTIVLLHNIMETVDLEKAGFSSNQFVKMIIKLAGTILTRLILTVDLVSLTIPKYVEILQEKYHTKKAVLIPHGTFNDVADPVMELPSGPLKIMAFGKFGTYKKVETLIESFQILKSQNASRKLELVIAGTNNPNAPGYLENAKKVYGHVDDIKFTGYVEEVDVPRLFKEAAVVVFPYTSTTGSSGVLHQAGSFGKAVVLPQIGDFIELTREEGYASEVFKVGDAESMASAIERIISDPERRMKLGHQNFLAARGLPITEVVDWYLIHFNQLKKAKENSKFRRVFKRFM